MTDPLFLLELGGVVLLLAVLARVAVRLGFSPIPLYLLAGLAFGRGGAIPLVTAEAFVEAGAEIGLILLLFSLGLEYSARELVDSLRATAPVGLADLVLNFSPGLLAGLILGWDPASAVFLGGVTYISSSGIAARTLEDLGWTGNRETPLVLAVLVMEDLVMAGFLPLTAVLLVGDTVGSVLLSLSVALLVVVGVLVVAARFGPAISRAVFSRSDEALLLGILGILLLTAGATEALNVSAAVGAFLAGIVFSGPAADRARSLLVPLRAVFAGVFFLFFGFNVDPGTIPSAIVPAMALAIVGAATKQVTGWIGARRAGLGRRARIRAGVTLIARGEFSIVIAGLGVAGGAAADLGPFAAAYVLILAVAGPVLARLADHATTRSVGAPPVRGDGGDRPGRRPVPVREGAPDRRAPAGGRREGSG